jgi:hypothetical protein
MLRNEHFICATIPICFEKSKEHCDLITMRIDVESRNGVHWLHSLTLSLTLDKTNNTRIIVSLFVVSRQRTAIVETKYKK